MDAAADWLDDPVDDVVAYLGQPTAVLGTRYIWERYRERYLDASGKLVCDEGNTCVLSDRGAVANFLRRGGNYRCAIVVTVHPQTETVRSVDFNYTDNATCERVWGRP